MSYQINRVQPLNRLPIKQKGQYVLYFMSASLRVGHNYALQHALALSQELQKPLRVIYHLYDMPPDYSYRHYHFMLMGLKEVIAQLQAKHIGFELLEGDFRRAFKEAISSAAVWVLDRSYLRRGRHQHEWFAEHAHCAVVEVEDNVMVPVESVSSKAEWMARTLRPKLHQKMRDFTQDIEEGISFEDFQKLPAQTFDDPLCEDAKHWQQLYERIDLFLANIEKQRPMSVGIFTPGEQAALSTLHHFSRKLLPHYDENRNHPELKATSHLSAYLHFGMISPLTIFEEVDQSRFADPFIEQFVVRRELSINYVHFTPHYDRFTSLPPWARRTLRDHSRDDRPYLYSVEQLEQADTHDPYWNAAMRELLRTGYMENVMRMYWGKKIIEWTSKPEVAFERLLQLNNRYFLDGSDPNSYVGVGWCFGLHDRPWMNRPVFGLIRYMNDSGLRRKFKIDSYVAQFPE